MLQLSFLLSPPHLSLLTCRVEIITCTSFNMGCMRCFEKQQILCKLEYLLMMLFFS